jgi:methionyl-tRNA formyltransferase
MGSPEFARPSLAALARAYTVVGVVTQPDRPAGRGRSLTPPPIKRLADELGLPTIQPPRLRQPEPMAALRAWQPDLIVVVAFGQILRAEVLDLAPFGCLNVHASLLPRWRGAAPIQAAILAGDPVSGVTTMRLDPGVDTGPILRQHPYPIPADATAADLSAALAELGAQALLADLPPYLAGTLVPQPQPAAGATYAPMLTKADGRLDLNEAAAALARRVRAFFPWPGAWIEFEGAPLKILRAHALPDGGGGATAGRTVAAGLPALVTADGLLALDEVQPAGRKPVSGAAFLQGARTWTG